jgi:aryl-alcohol dehydrogenase-like predicted oxidoreductase
MIGRSREVVGENAKRDRRPLDKTGLQISPVALGCWPIAGVTTLDTNDDESLATIRRCFDLGINHLDAAYVYGPNGESEKLIRRALAGRRDEMVIATKCGVHYEGSVMVNDGRPETLRRECEESLERLGTRSASGRENASRWCLELQPRAIASISGGLSNCRRSTSF